MPASASSSATETLSSVLCMVVPTRPNSATGQWRAMKRASEVPPPVSSFGVRPVLRVMAAVGLVWDLHPVPDHIRADIATEHDASALAA